MIGVFRIRVRSFQMVSPAASTWPECGSGLVKGGAGSGSQARVQRVATSSSRVPCIRCSESLPTVTALNSRKSITYSARLVLHIIVRYPGPCGRYFQRICLEFQALHFDCGGGPVPHGR